MWCGGWTGSGERDLDHLVLCPSSSCANRFKLRYS